MTQSTVAISAAPVEPSPGRDLEDVLREPTLEHHLAISSELSASPRSA